MQDGDMETDPKSVTAAAEAIVQLLLKPSYPMDNHNDTIRDIAITITNKLIELGYVPDCTDTDDESEFEVQDTIVEVLELNIPPGTFDSK